MIDCSIESLLFFSRLLYFYPIHAIKKIICYSKTSGFVVQVVDRTILHEYKSSFRTLRLHSPIESRALRNWELLL